jgi:hypothetical protein
MDAHKPRARVGLDFKLYHYQLLRLAMEIRDDRARDRYFERVATALRGRAVTDMAVRVAANAAFAAEAPRTVQEDVMPPAPDACVLGRWAGSSRWATG